MISKQSNTVSRRDKPLLKAEEKCYYKKVLGIVKSQLPAILAIVSVEAMLRLQGYSSSAFSLVALILLTAVIYTSLHHGIRQGLTSATIVILYNTISLGSKVELYSFEDQNVRRIVLLAVVLPALAFIVGRLKERNDQLLKYEKSARYKAEESEDRLRFMAESMPQKIFTNDPDGMTDYFNPQWMEYTGLSYKELKNGDWTKLIHPDDVKQNVSKWRHSLKTGESFTVEHRLRRHDGVYRWHVSRAKAMRDDDGKIIKWVGSDTDIDDIKVALQREHTLEVKAATLAEQREQLVALNKAKDEFISLSSHQLRTPATGVKQYLGMVLEGYSGDLSVSQRAFLQQAYDSNERQITIINDLLRVAQVDAGNITLHKEKTDIILLLQDVIDEQASKFAERHQKLLFIPKLTSLIATVDKVNLRMVLENIIDNASKYTPHNKNIELTASKSKGMLLITIKDEGVGIAQEDIDKIFTKFSRIDNPLSMDVGGSGLGLYWAKKIIDLHGGQIKVLSEINKGTTFTLSLLL